MEIRNNKVKIIFSLIKHTQSSNENIVCKLDHQISSPNVLQKKREIRKLQHEKEVCAVEVKNKKTFDFAHALVAHKCVLHVCLKFRKFIQLRKF